MTIPPHHHIDARTVGQAGITATTTDLTAVRLVAGESVAQRAVTR